MTKNLDKMAAVQHIQCSLKHFILAYEQKKTNRPGYRPENHWCHFVVKDGH